MFSPKSKSYLLSFKEIRDNGYHIQSMNEINLYYLGITKNVSGHTCIEKFSALSSGLYWTKISAIETYFISK